MTYMQLTVTVWKMTPHSKYSAVVEVMDIDRPTNYEALISSERVALTVPSMVADVDVPAWVASVLAQVSSAYTYNVQVKTRAGAPDIHHQDTLF